MLFDIMSPVGATLVCHVFMSSIYDVIFKELFCKILVLCFNIFIVWQNEPQVTRAFPDSLVHYLTGIFRKYK